MEYFVIEYSLPAPRSQQPYRTAAQCLELQRINAVFQQKTHLFQGQFSILSAFSAECSGERWHFYCNSIRLPLGKVPVVQSPVTVLRISHAAL